VSVFSHSLSLFVAAALLAAASILPATVFGQSFSYTPPRQGAFASGAYQVGNAAQSSIQGVTNSLADQAGTATAGAVSQMAGTASPQDGVTPNSLWPTQGSVTSAPGVPTQAGPVLPAAGNDAAGNTAAVSTAAGPDLPPLSDSDSASVMWSYDPSQDLRQSGQSVDLARHQGVSDLADYRSRVWLEEWHHQLIDRDLVSEDHFWFQARRLDKADFSLWASRLVWAAGPVPRSVPVQSTSVFFPVSTGESQPVTSVSRP
jgi:hypothetical protein